MEKVKISNHQLFSLTACNSIGAGVIITSSLIVKVAKQDAWISALVSPVLGLFIIWIMMNICGKFPNNTFVGVIKQILGKWIGTIFAVSYVLLNLLIASNMPWYTGNFLNTHVMPETPSYIINMLYIIAVVIAILYGLETFARASELFILFASFLFFMAMLLNMPNAKIQNLQPVFEKGFLPALKSSIILLCFTTFHTINLLMIYPLNLTNIKEAKKSIYKGYLWASFVNFITILVSLLVLGNTIVAKSEYSTYILAKEINVGVIFSRVEFIVAALWIVTQYMICILFFYSGITGLSELIGIKDYKKLVIPMGLIVLAMSEVVFPNNVYHARWISLVWLPYIITHGFFIPALLLIVYWFRKTVFKSV